MGAIDGVTEELADIAAGELVEGIVLGDDVEVGLEGIVQELAQLAEFCADGGEKNDGAVHGETIFKVPPTPLHKARTIPRLPG